MLLTLESMIIAVIEPPMILVFGLFGLLTDTQCNSSGAWRNLFCYFYSWPRFTISKWRQKGKSTTKCTLMNQFGFRAMTDFGPANSAVFSFVASLQMTVACSIVKTKYFPGNGFKIVWWLKDSLRLSCQIFFNFISATFFFYIRNNDSI